MSSELKLGFIKQVISTGNDLKRLFPAIKPLQESNVCQEFILHVEQADWQNANRLSTPVAAIVRAARLRSAAAVKFATALEQYRQATNATLNILQVEAIEAKQAEKVVQSNLDDDMARRIGAMSTQAVEQPQPSKLYPQPRLLLRDAFIWKNIRKMPRLQLIQELKIQKNFGLLDTVTTAKGFKDAALRYSRYHRLPTRTFRSETPYSPTDTD